MKLIGFKKFVEETNPGAFTQSEPTPFGSGRSLELPSHEMDDISTTVTGKVIDIQKIRGKSVVDLEEERSRIVIKVKTPEGVFQIDHKNKSLPVIGQAISITLDRNKKILNYK